MIRGPVDLSCDHVAGAPCELCAAEAAERSGPATDLDRPVVVLGASPSGVELEQAPFVATDAEPEAVGAVRDQDDDHEHDQQLTHPRHATEHARSSSARAITRRRWPSADAFIASLAELADRWAVEDGEQDRDGTGPAISRARQLDEHLPIPYALTDKARAHLAARAGGA